MPLLWRDEHRGNRGRPAAVPRHGQARVDDCAGVAQPGTLAMTLDTARWQKIGALFSAAAALHGGERQEFLSRECTDAALRAEIEGLLDSHEAHGPVDRLVAELAPTVDQVHAHAPLAPGL